MNEHPKRSFFDRYIETARKHPAVTATLGSVGIAAMVLVGTNENRSSADQMPTAPVSQQDQSPEMVTVESIDSKSVEVELETITPEKAIEVVAADISSVKFGGARWVGGYIDDDGNQHIIGGINIEDTDQYDKKYTEKVVLDPDTNEYGVAAQQTVAGFIMHNGSPELTQALAEYRDAMMAAANAANKLAALYSAGEKPIEEASQELGKANNNVRDALQAIRAQLRSMSTPS